MNSKKSIFIVVISVLSVIAIFALILIQNNGKYNQSYFYSMDTCVEILGDNEIIDDIENIFNETEDIFDIHDEKSEASILNRNKSITASEKLLNAAKDITQLNSIYGNSADITIGSITKLWDITAKEPVVPEENLIAEALKSVDFKNIQIENSTITLNNNAVLDFGAVAKGIALDYVKEELDRQNSDKAVVSAGSSSILLYGNDTFTTSIKSPDSDGILGKLHTASGFVSTSGGYHRYAEIDGKKYIHIFDTKTGMPSETDLTSVTVYCQKGLDSDFLSTMIFTEGTENIDKYLENEDFLVLAVDKNKKIYKSQKLDFELTDESYSYAEKN